MKRLPYILALLFLLNCTVIQTNTRPVATEKIVVPKSEGLIRYFLDTRFLLEKKEHSKAIKSVLNSAGYRAEEVKVAANSNLIVTMGLYKKDFTAFDILMATIAGFSMGLIPVPIESYATFYVFQSRLPDGRRAMFQYRADFVPIGSFWWVAFAQSSVRKKASKITKNMTRRFLSEQEHYLKNVPVQKEEVFYKRLVLKDGRFFSNVRANALDKKTIQLTLPDQKQIKINKRDIKSSKATEFLDKFW